MAEYFFFIEIFKILAFFSLNLFKKNNELVKIINVIIE